MIFTVICSAAHPDPSHAAWSAQLAGYSWGRAQQPGELVHVVPERSRESSPCHPLARVTETQSWSPHPFTGDLYPPYQQAAGVMAWLFTERIDGTVLLLDPSSVMGRPVADQVRPGQAQGTGWSGLPQGSGPFGLGPGLAFLQGVCVDRGLDLPAVQLPVLIHSTDLRKIAPRWLELMSIIRAETATRDEGPRADADKIAYVIAAAEARIQHVVADLGIFDARTPVLALDGQIAWDPTAYRDGDPVLPASAAPGPGRDCLTVLAELLERRAEGWGQALLRPHRQRGVREGKILGSMFLEIPGRADTVSLNSSGSAIWEICDGTRSLAEINRELETRFDMPPGSLRADIEVVIKRLEHIGALKLASA